MHYTLYTSGDFLNWFRKSLHCFDWIATLNSKPLSVRVFYWDNLIAPPGAPQQAPRRCKMGQDAPKSCSRPARKMLQASKTLRSPKSQKSMNPKGLAPSRRMKKAGGRRWCPLGQVNPPPAPQGRSRACWIETWSRWTLKALRCLRHQQILKS